MVRNSFVWVGFPTFDIFLHTKAVPKVIGNCFCTEIIFNNPIKTGFLDK